MSRLKSRFRSYLRDEDGVVLAETLIILPLLVWVLVALFVYWDVWRTVNVSQKAAYSIADLLSRQEDPIPVDFIPDMQNVLTFLTPGSPLVSMRVTSFEYDEEDEEYCLLLSQTTTEAIQPLTEAAIQPWRGSRIPTLSDRESVFVVETWVNHVPRFDAGVMNVAPGLGQMTFGEFIVTRPRHRRLVLEGNQNCL